MFCIECGVRNPEGAKFCRECGLNIAKVAEQGALLPGRASVALNIERPTTSAEESERVRHLLDMAFWHSEAGHLASARSACEAALKLDPFSSSALSLLGLIYEKQGNIDKAIEIFEKIVAINPGSVADEQKLDALRLGKQTPAVAPSLLHRLMPPAFLEVIRKYPTSPMILGLAACSIALIFGIVGYLHSTKPVNSVGQSSSDLNSIPSRVPLNTGQISAPFPAENPSATQAIQSSAPSSANGIYQDPQALDRAVAEAIQENLRRNDRRDSDRGSAVTEQMPSVNQLQPLTVPSSSIPTHVVSVAPAQPPLSNHIIDVAPPTADSSNSSTAGADSSQSSAGQDPSDADAPAPPMSHIYVTVQGASGNAAGQDSGSSGVTLPNNDSQQSITLRQNAGEALQQKGLNLSQAGNYKAAEAAYESAIAEFQQDISNGRNVDEAKRGIDACQVAIQICKQSQ